MVVGLEDATNALQRDQQLPLRSESSQAALAQFTSSALWKGHLQCLRESSDSSTSACEDLEDETKINADLA
eukprot:6127077-Karenia_brevis.AAC.1